MKRLEKKFLILSFLLFSTITFMACTGNPFSDDEIAQGNRQITGKVELSGKENPEGVYVWLEGFDVGTRTDQNGDFKITLPSTAQVAGGITGIFKLYFYIANFKVATTDVVVRDGSFVFSTGGINKKGELQRPKFMSRILEISTDLTPATFSEDDAIFLKVDVLLSFEQKSFVFYPTEVFDGPNKLIAPLFVKNVETDEVFLTETTLIGINNPDSIRANIGTKYMRTMLLILGSGVLAEGQYKIIPYLLILEPDDVPLELFNNLVTEVNSFGFDYLNIPILQTKGILTVVESEPKDP